MVLNNILMNRFIPKKVSIETSKDKINRLVNKIEKAFEQGKRRKKINTFLKNGYQTEEVFDIPDKSVMRDICELCKIVGLVPSETKIEIIETIHKRRL